MFQWSSTHFSIWCGYSWQQDANGSLPSEKKVKVVFVLGKHPTFYIIVMSLCSDLLSGLLSSPKKILILGYSTTLFLEICFPFVSFPYALIWTFSILHYCLSFQIYSFDEFNFFYRACCMIMIECFYRWPRQRKGYPVCKYCWALWLHASQRWWPSSSGN